MAWRVGGVVFTTEHTKRMEEGIHREGAKNAKAGFARNKSSKAAREWTALRAFFASFAPSRLRV